MEKGTLVIVDFENVDIHIDTIQNLYDRLAQKVVTADGEVKNRYFRKGHDIYCWGPKGATYSEEYRNRKLTRYETYPYLVNTDSAHNSDAFDYQLLLQLTIEDNSQLKLFNDFFEVHEYLISCLWLEDNEKTTVLELLRKWRDICNDFYRRKYYVYKFEPSFQACYYDEDQLHKSIFLGASALQIRDNRRSLLDKTKVFKNVGQAVFFGGMKETLIGIYDSLQEADNQCIGYRPTSRFHDHIIYTGFKEKISKSLVLDFAKKNIFAYTSNEDLHCLLNLFYARFQESEHDYSFPIIDILETWKEHRRNYHDQIYDLAKSRLIDQIKTGKFDLQKFLTIRPFAIDIQVDFYNLPFKVSIIFDDYFDRRAGRDRKEYLVARLNEGKINKDDRNLIIRMINGYQDSDGLLDHVISCSTVEDIRKDCDRLGISFDPRGGFVSKSRLSPSRLYQIDKELQQLNKLNRQLEYHKFKLEEKDMTPIERKLAELRVNAERGVEDFWDDFEE